MPKKPSTNPKAEAARERKEEVKKSANEKKVKAAEDAKWVDEGSTATEKRRLEKAAKDAEDAKKRAEKKALQAKEEAAAAAISGKAKGVSNADKISRAQLLRQAEEATELRRIEAERVKMEAMKLQPQAELQPNLNRAISEDAAQDIATYGAGNVIRASGMDSALGAVAGNALTSASAASPAAAAAAIDAHPEKRMKAAYAAYEEEQMPLMREEHPRLKLSQYKERIFARWQKSPENPKNIRAAQEQSLLEQTDAYKYGNFRE